MAKSAFDESLSLLRTGRFGTFIFASLLSNLGTWTQQLAEPWLLLTLGASSFLVGLDSFASAAPVMVLTVLGGLLADKADRRRVIAVCQSLQMLCPILLVVLIQTGQVRPWMVIVLSLVVGITDALSMPSFQTIAPTLVDDDKVASALALNATQFNLSRVLGPVLAGLLLATVGAVGCFTVNAASYLPFIWVSLWALPRGRSAPAAQDATGDHNLFGGIAHILETPELVGTLLTVLLTAILCTPLIVFCPVLVKDVLHGDATHFSIALGGFGIGGLLGAVALLGVDPGLDRRRICSRFAQAYGVLVALVALDPWFLALPGLLALAGSTMTISNTSANAFLQTTAGHNIRGQAISLYMIALRGGIAVGSLMTGVVASLTTVRHALLINGLLAVAAQGFVGYRYFHAGRTESNQGRS